MLPRRLLLFASLWVVVLASLAGAQTPAPVPTNTPAATSTAAATSAPAASGTPTATGTPNGTPTATPTSAPVISATSYRARLIGAKNAITRQRPPINATNALGGLKNPVTVKRSDGATQTTNGDEWAEWLANTRTGNVNVAKLTGAQARQLVKSLDEQLKLFDEWNTPKGGAYFQADPNAQRIVKQLEDSGQIRTGPLWWQSLWARSKNWIGEQFSNFVTWLGSLLPKRGPSINMPNLSWLWWVFWFAVIGILGVILYFLYQAFGGMLGWRFSTWGFRKRKRAQVTEFVGEDAELMLLPPDELRQRAQQYASQGNFREALRHRFIALLLHLDQRGVWRYDIRRTNWEHIAALRREEIRLPLVDPLSDLTQRFDRVRYGGADCTQAEWSRFEHDIEGFEARIGPARVAEVAR